MKKLSCSDLGSEEYAEYTTRGLFAVKLSEKSIYLYWQSRANLSILNVHYSLIVCCE